jgi:hypothetical protein
MKNKENKQFMDFFSEKYRKLMKKLEMMIKGQVMTKKGQNG